MNKRNAVGIRYIYSSLLAFAFPLPFKKIKIKLLFYLFLDVISSHCRFDRRWDNSKQNKRLSSSFQILKSWSCQILCIFHSYFSFHFCFCYAKVSFFSFLYSQVFLSLFAFKQIRVSIVLYFHDCVHWTSFQKSNGWMNAYASLFTLPLYFILSSHVNPQTADICTCIYFCDSCLYVSLTAGAKELNHHQCHVSSRESQTPSSLFIAS